MHAVAHTVSVSPRLALVGRIVSGLVALFLAFDGVAKVLMVPAVIEASAQLGVPESAIAGIGLVLLACTALYVVPPTAVLGAILLTGYLGGATATHVRMGGPVFPVVFAVLVGVLVWGGLYLREPRLHALLPVRR
jgi:hypothetical protein